MNLTCNSRTALCWEIIITKFKQPVSEGSERYFSCRNTEILVVCILDFFFFFNFNLNFVRVMFCYPVQTNFLKWNPKDLKKIVCLNTVCHNYILHSCRRHHEFFSFTAGYRYRRVSPKSGAAFLNYQNLKEEYLHSENLTFNLQLSMSALVPQIVKRGILSPLAADIISSDIFCSVAVRRATNKWPSGSASGNGWHLLLVLSGNTRSLNALFQTTTAAITLTNRNLLRQGFLSPSYSFILCR